MSTGNSLEVATSTVVSLKKKKKTQLQRKICERHSSLSAVVPRFSFRIEKRGLIWNLPYTFETRSYFQK